MSEFAPQEVPNTEKKDTVEYPEIAALEQPIKNIFEQLKGEIDIGGYSLIIGIDTSGRIPALITQDAMGQIYEKKGFRKPEIFFCAGFRSASGEKTKSKKREKLKSEFTRFVQQSKIDLEKSKRVLIVEDAVSKGGSIRPVAFLLKDMGFDMDIAAVGLVGEPEKTKLDEEQKSDREEDFTVRVVVGMRGNPSIYRTPYLSGVVKNPKDVFSEGFGMSVKRKAAFLEGLQNRTKNQEKTLKRIKKLANGDLESFFSNIQVEGVNLARKDAHLVANHIAQDYLKQDK